MSKLALSQWRGVKDLAQDAVDAGVQAIATAHLRIARKPFAILERIDAIAVPVRAVEGIHDLITRGVYDSIRLITRVAGAAATEVLDRLERKADEEEALPVRRGQLVSTMEAHPRGIHVAKPNYQFEKRQKELAKKKAQEEKRQRKLAAKTEGAPEETPDTAPASQPTPPLK